jgi:nitrite reductase (NADH) small subunit/3-phenylpropionate/trans-cinnamate dioxygenase ferredoxin subunit
MRRARLGKRWKRMGALVKVALVSDLEPGQGKTVERRGVAIALFNVDGTFRAIKNACCHHGGPLAAGELTGTIVACPWHGWRFDVVTGSTLRNAEIGVPTYRVEVRGDEVFVELP